MLTTYGVVTGTPIARPGYNTWVREYAGYATQIKRICGNAGDVIPVVGGKWHTPWARHRYSKRQPWNADGSKILIDQKDGGDPARMVLDATTLAPLWSSRDGNARAEKLRTSSEVQWRPGFPTQMVTVRKGAAANTVEVEVWDTATTAGTTVGSVIVISLAASGSFPATTHGTDGVAWNSEGTISDDGRWTVLSTKLAAPQSTPSVHDYLVVVDLLSCVVGNRVDISPYTQAYDSSCYGKIDYCGISTTGNYVDVKLSGDSTRTGWASGDQYGFILNVDKTPASGFPCTAHAMDPNVTPVAIRMGPAAARGAAGAALGLIAWLSHSDWNVDDGGNEVMVGGGRGWAVDKYGRNGCNFPSDIGKKYGTAIMVNVANGVHTHVGPGSDQVGGGVRFADLQHSSGRATGRRGWHLITTDKSNRAEVEVMWVRLLAGNTPGGTRSIERLCKLRTDDAGRYYAEAQAVAKPDGSQVMFASNWQGVDANPPGVIGDSKAYIVSNTLTAPVPPPTGYPQGPYRVRVDM